MWVLQSFDWKKWRPQILELLLHHSNILDIVPPKSKDWIPIVHDSLLFFSESPCRKNNWSDVLLNFAYLPPDSDRGERILQFVSKTPAFQKIGQILARNPNIPVDVREALQVLENSLQTTNRDELVNWICPGNRISNNRKISDPVFRKKSLPRAASAQSSGPLWSCRGETDREEAVCKIIKPYVLRALPEELSIINELTLYFGAHREFYEIEAIPLEEMFRDLSEALSKEIKIDEEQRNLVRARAYYQGNRRILVQKLYPFSTEHSSFMEFVEGEKISDAFTGDSRRRAKLARRLSDALTFDVIFFRSGGGPLSR